MLVRMPANSGFTLCNNARCAQYIKHGDGSFGRAASLKEDATLCYFHKYTTLQFLLSTHTIICTIVSVSDNFGSEKFGLYIHPLGGGLVFAPNSYPNREYPAICHFCACR